MDVVIIEDEKLSAEHLDFLLRKVDERIAVIARFDTVRESVKAFREGLKPDLIFMDIHLADGNGFEVFGKVDPGCPIIFTTAFDQYAIQAFKLNSIDYLLKPISLESLQFALGKLKEQQQDLTRKLLEDLMRTYQRPGGMYKSRFMVKVGEAIETIRTEDIHHFLSRESLSWLVTAKGKRYIVDHTMDELEAMVSPQDFFRINRKVILHIGAVKKVMGYFNGRLSISADFLDDDSRIVSRERVNDFKKWLAI